MLCEIIELIFDALVATFFNKKVIKTERPNLYSSNNKPQITCFKKQLDIPFVFVFLKTRIL